MTEATNTKITTKLSDMSKEEARDYRFLWNYKEALIEALDTVRKEHPDWRLPDTKSPEYKASFSQFMDREWKECRNCPADNEKMQFAVVLRMKSHVKPWLESVCIKP